MLHPAHALTGLLLAFGLVSQAHAIEAKDCAARGERAADLWVSMSLAEEVISEIPQLVDGVAKGKDPTTLDSNKLTKSAESAALATKSIGLAKGILAKVDVPSLADGERAKAMLLIIRLASVAQINATRAAWVLPVGEAFVELVDEASSDLITELSTHAECLLISK